MSAIPSDRDRHRVERASGLVLACLVQCALLALLMNGSGRAPTAERSTRVAMFAIPLPPERATPPVIRARDDRPPERTSHRRWPVSGPLPTSLPEAARPTVVDPPSMEPAATGAPLPYDRDRTAREMRAMERSRSRSASNDAFEAATAPNPETLAKGVEKAIRPDCKEAYRGYLLLAVPFLVKDTLTGKGCKW